MPPSKPKPSDIAAEAKRSYIPYCETNYPQYPPNSLLYSQAAQLAFSPRPVNPASSRLRVAVIAGDPIDVAFDWYDFEAANKPVGQGSAPVARIPVVNAANEKRPGGDWELGLIASEENLCRRSNLVQCLNTPWPGQMDSLYPIPNYGGIYSPHVVVFRSGSDKGFSVWPEFRSIPVISVAPSRRPKLDENGEKYSFVDEANHVKNKIRTILRIAADRQHQDIVIGPWGLGQIYRNPARELARMWHNVLFNEKEFENRFSNVVFAIDTHLTGDSDKSVTSPSASEYEIFREELDASNVHKEGFLLRTQ